MHTQTYYRVRTIVRIVFWTSAFIAGVSLANIISGVRY